MDTGGRLAIRCQPSSSLSTDPMHIPDRPLSSAVRGSTHEHQQGADPDVIESRVTHTKKSRSAFAGYQRDGQWPETVARSRSCESLVGPV
jgi:hypothetical protein